MSKTIVIILLLLISVGLLYSQTNEDPLCIGCDAPTFSLPTLEQDYLSLRDYCGEKLRKPWINKTKHVVVISFFATWCEPCKKEVPHLERLQTEFENQPVKFFLIDVGEKREKVLRFIEEVGYTIPVLLDRYQKTAEKYEALTLPRLFVIDKQGKIRRKQKGFTNPEDFEIEMRELIGLLLEEK